MSTATSGLNEFPVLLRLPDLNAPQWAAKPANSIIAPASNPPPSEPVAVSSLATLNSRPEPQPKAQTPTSASTSLTQPLVTVETISATTVAPNPRQPTFDFPSISTLVSFERLPKIELSMGQWTLLRQFATGGVLVGGLALTYLLIMGGGNSETPGHVETADVTLEPPIIETPSALAADLRPEPVVVRPRGEDDVRDYAGPPDFSRDWQAPSSTPTHIEVADLPPREGLMSPPAVALDRPFSPAGEGTARYEGRIGPESSAAIQYPTTDPATYLYRPVIDTEAGRASTARLEGTIAPPPLR